MTRQQTTLVYYFLVSSSGRGCAGTVSTFKATREAIAHQYRGEVLEGTREEVPIDALDKQGRFRRVATGWGELAA